MRCEQGMTIYRKLQYENSTIDLTNTYANQKKEIANKGAAMIAISRRNSGGTGYGAYSFAARTYRGLK